MNRKAYAAPNSQIWLLPLALRERTAFDTNPPAPVATDAVSRLDAATDLPLVHVGSDGSERSWMRYVLYIYLDFSQLCAHCRGNSEGVSMYPSTTTTTLRTRGCVGTPSGLESLIIHSTHSRQTATHRSPVAVCDFRRISKVRVHWDATPTWLTILQPERTTSPPRAASSQTCTHEICGCAVHEHAVTAVTADVYHHVLTALTATLMTEVMGSLRLGLLYRHPGFAPRRILSQYVSTEIMGKFYNNPLRRSPVNYKGRSAHGCPQSTKLLTHSWMIRRLTRSCRMR